MNTWWNAINFSLIVILAMWIHISRHLHVESIERVEKMELQLEEHLNKKDSIVVTVVNNINLPNK